MTNTVKQMKQMNRKLLPLSLGLVLATAVATFGQDREERISRRIQLGDGGELSLSNISGDIRVTGNSGSELVIEAVKRLHGGADRDLLADVEVEISEMGNRVRIETHYPRGRHRGHDRGGVSVDYEITLPRGAEVELSSVSGDITLASVEGASRVQTVSGSVEARDIANLVTAKSVSGDVDIANAKSSRDAHIESVSGDVTVRGLEARELDISSVSGDVRIESVSSERGNLSSTSGDIEYTGSIARGGRYELQSHSGDVVLSIGEDIGFELEASTFSGDIDTEFPVRVTSRGSQGRRLTGTVGDGSAFIDATTFSGDIRIRRR